MTDTVYYDETTGQYVSEDEFLNNQDQFEVVDSFAQEDEPFYYDIYAGGKEFLGDLVAGVGEATAVGLDAVGLDEEAEYQRLGAQEFRHQAQKSRLERGDDANTFLLGTLPQAAAQIGTLFAAPYTLPIQAASTAGNKYRQVIDAGDTENTALTAAGIAGVTDTAANLLALKYIPGAGRGVGGLLKAAGIEGGEEAATEAVDIVSDYVTAVPDPSLPEVGTRLAHAFGAGAIGGGTVQGISNVVSPSVEVQPEVEIEFQNIPEQNIETDLQTVPPTDITDPNSPSFESIASDAGILELVPQVQNFLDNEFSNQAVNVLDNTQELKVNPNNLVDTYKQVSGEDSTKDFVRYVEDIKPTPNDLQIFVNNTSYIVDKQDVDNHLYQVAKTATEVVVPEGRVSPVINNDGSIEDVGNLDLQIDTSDSHTTLMIKDKQNTQRGAIILKDDGSPKSQADKNHGYLNNFEQRGKPIWKEKLQDFWDNTISVQEMKRRFRVDGFSGVADALEGSLDTLNQQIGYTTDAMDRLQDYLALDDTSIDTVTSAIINMRMDKKVNPKKDYSNIEQVLRDAQVTDNKTNKTRKFTEEEIKGAVSLRETTNGLLKNVLDTERFVKEDSIHNSTDAAIKAAKQLVRQNKLSDATYSLFVEKMVGLREKSITRMNSALDKAYDNLTVNPYFPLSRFGDYLVGVTDAEGNLLEYHATENQKEQSTLLKRLDKKYKEEGATVNLFSDTRKRDYNTANPYHNVPTPILRSIAQAEQEANFGVLLDQAMQDIETQQLDTESDLDDVKEKVKAEMKKALSDATDYFAENLANAAGRDNLGFSARFVEPNFTKGWSKDFRRTINKYVYDAAKYASEKRSHSKLMREAAKVGDRKQIESNIRKLYTDKLTEKQIKEKIEKAYGQAQSVKNYLHKHVDNAYRSGTDPKLIAAWKTATYYYYLGFGYIKSAISNIVGGGVMLGPMLNMQIQDTSGRQGTLNHLKNAATQTGQYTLNAKKFKTKLHKQDPVALKVLDELERQGILTSKYYDQFVNEASNPTTKGYTPLQALKDSDLFFRGSEFLLRSQTAFSSLQASKGKSFEERLKLVKDLNREVAGDFSRFNRPMVAHNSVAKLGLMFRNWQFQYLANLSRMLRNVPKDRGKSIGMYLGTTAMINGVFESVPFLDDIMEVFQKLFPITYGELEEWAGVNGMNVFHYGALAAAFGEKSPQVASSGGGANMLPRAQNEYELAGKLVLGAPGSMITKMKYGYDQWALGNTYKAVETIAPQSIKKAMGAARQYGLIDGEEPGLRDHKGQAFYKQDGSAPVMPDMFDSVLNAIGLSNIEQSNAYKRYYTAKNLLEAYKDNTLNQRYAIAYLKGGEEAVAKLDAQIARENEELPLARQKRKNNTRIKKMIRGKNQDKVQTLVGARKDLKQSIYNQVTKSNQ